MNQKPGQEFSNLRPKREMLVLIDRYCDEFEAAFVTDKRLEIETVVERVGAEARPILLRELIDLEIQLRRQKGENPELSEYVDRFPAYEIPDSNEDSTQNRDGNQEATIGKLTLAGEKTVASLGHTEVAKQRNWGDYQLLDEIARGGMGVVFRARQLKANRIVALKMILSGTFAGEEAIQRFQREAEAAASLEHPGIVPIYDVGEWDGQPFFSMGLMEGESLKQRLADGPLTARESASLLLKIAEGISYAHRQGVIHRDLKPANILFDELGQPRITDFGLAKTIQSDDELTVTGQLMGTPGYMPPEQAAGESSNIDCRSDVYSLGALLYCMTTGRPPFQAASVIETIKQVMELPPVDPRALNPELDRDLETLCMKCLEKESSKRYQTAEELCAELRRYLDSKPIKARPISSPARLWRLCRRRPFETGLISFVAVSLIVATCVSSYFAVLAKKRADQAEQGTLVAVDALETMINRVQIRLKLIPGTEELRREILMDALASLQAISSELNSQDRVDQTTAMALLDLAELQLQVGDQKGFMAQKEAKANIERALEIMSQVREKSKDTLEVERDYATALQSMAGIHIERGNLGEAKKWLLESLEVHQQLVEKYPDHPHLRIKLVGILMLVGDYYSITGDFEKAIEIADQAFPHAEFALENGPDHRALTMNMVSLHELKGDSLHDLGRNEQALEQFQAGLRLNQELLSEHDTADIHDSLAFSYERLGNHWYQVADYDQAMICYEQMKQSCEKATEMAPAVRNYLEGVGVANEKIAKAARATGDQDLAKEAMANAKAIFRQLGE